MSRRKPRTGLRVSECPASIDIMAALFFNESLKRQFTFLIHTSQSSAIVATGRLVGMVVTRWLGGDIGVFARIWADAVLPHSPNGTPVLLRYSPKTRTGTLELNPSIATESGPIDW